MNKFFVLDDVSSNNPGHIVYHVAVPRRAAASIAQCNSKGKVINEHFG
jgi:hypothetical protein